jgi:hypothetical protein
MTLDWICAVVAAVSFILITECVERDSTKHNKPLDPPQFCSAGSKLFWDGTCECPIEGKCFECGSPCTDHDLVADYYWCDACIGQHLRNDAIWKGLDEHGL